jgi:hypothetical protein
VVQRVQARLPLDRPPQSFQGRPRLPVVSQKLCQRQRAGRLVGIVLEILPQFAGRRCVSAQRRPQRPRRRHAHGTARVVQCLSQCAVRSRIERVQRLRRPEAHERRFVAQQADQLAAHARLVDPPFQQPGQNRARRPRG